MAGKISPAAQAKLALYEGFTPHVARLHSLVEQFAVAKVKRDDLKPALKRAAGQTKVRFMSSGLDTLAQQCGAIEMAASRGGSPIQVARVLRELVGSLRFQLELEIRTIIREDAEASAKETTEESANETQV
jgi:hypothetical protein